jgi:hypothetical protein
MSIAYLVLAHTAPEQVARLVGRLSNPRDAVIVHVDRRSDMRPFEAAFARLPVAPIMTPRRTPVHWAGHGIVAATLILMRTALAQPRTFSHLVLISGADYPIRSNDELQEHFAGHPGESFMSWSAGDHPAPVSDEQRRGNAEWYWSGDLHRLTSWTISVRGRRWQFPSERVPYQIPRRLPRGLRTPYQGSAWWNLTPEAADYCLRFLARRPDAAAYFRFVLMPDENIFQMILLAAGSPLRDTIVNEDLRYMHWAGNSPPTLTAADVPEMRASHKLFARKLDLAVEPATYDALDAAAGVAPDA